MGVLVKLEREWMRLFEMDWAMKLGNTRQETRERDETVKKGSRPALNSARAQSQHLFSLPRLKSLELMS